MYPSSTPGTARAFTRINPLYAAVVLAAAGLLHGLPALAVEPVSGEAAQPAAEDARLGTVTVNARRREERAQDVPTAMTVVGGDVLEAQNVSQVQDIQQLVPSLNSQFWHARQSSLSIRGLGNNPASDGLEGSAAVYLDNVYLSRPGMAVFDLLDIEQLELLRGPQGTLFGKNTTAGVLNLSTRQPTFQPERKLSISAGEYGLWQTRGTVSGPLSESLAGRLSFYRTHKDGFIKNVYDGHYQGRDSEGLRGQLLFQPDDNFDLRLIADYNEEDLDSTRLFTSYGGLAAPQATVGRVGATVITDPKDLKVNTDGRNGVNVHQGGFSAEANWKLANDYKLTSISAWRFWDFSPHNDDLTDAPAISRVGASANSRQFSQELRLASPLGERFDYVVGGYYFWSQLGNNNFTTYGSAADLWNNTPTGALNNVSTRATGRIETNSYALFAQGTWHLDERWDLTAGLRGTYEEKSARVKRYAPTGPDASTAALAARNSRFGALDSGNLGLTGSSPSALVTLSHRFNDQLLGYATLSHGEKSGGINLAPGGVQVEPVIGTERVNNAEIGLKSNLFDDRLLFNASLFWAVASNYQATYRDAERNTAYLANVGDVRTRGVELEINARPIKGLSINANGSFTDATYLNYSSAPCAPENGGSSSVCNFNGKRVYGVPRQIFNLNGSYQWQYSANIQPYVNASYSYRAKSFGSLDNSRYAEIDGYGLANFAAGVRIGQGDDQWDASLWVRNAFDKFYYTNMGQGGSNAFYGVVGDPRTVGATLSYEF